MPSGRWSRPTYQPDLLSLEEKPRPIFLFCGMLLDRLPADYQDFLLRANGCILSERHRVVNVRRKGLSSSSLLCQELVRTFGNRRTLLLISTSRGLRVRCDSGITGLCRIDFQVVTETSKCGLMPVEWAIRRIVRRNWNFDGPWAISSGRTPFHQGI